MNTDLSDEALIMLYAEGDATAFYILYDRHKIKLYRFLYKLTYKQEALTNDLFQATWEAIIVIKDALDAKAKADKLHFAKYLYTIARNKMMDYYRKSSRQPTLSFDELSNSDNHDPLSQVADNNPLPLDQLNQKERSDLLLKAIERLPDDQQEVFLLRRAEFKFVTIADILEVSVDVVKGRHRRGLETLKELLNLGDDHA